MKPEIEIDGVMVIVWRHLSRQRATGYEVKHHYSQPGMRGGHFVPRRLGPAGISLYAKNEQSGWELWTEAEKLEVWPAEPLALGDIAVIDTTAKRITTKAHASVSVEVTRKLLTEREYQTVQQERLIAVMSQPPDAQTAKQPKQNQEPLPPPEVNETILWHVQQKIVDEVDTQLKSAPSASLVFTLYCRERMKLTTMSKRHGWPYRTLKDRKATLEAFLKENFRLTLAAFFVDRSIFSAAERQLQDHRARRISPHALGDDGHAEEEV